MPRIAVCILWFLLWAIVSDTLHELSHWALCRALGCPVTGLKIPFLLLRREGKKLCRFSLREQNHCTFRTGEPGKALVVTAAGPGLNLLLGAVLLFFAPVGSKGALIGSAYNFIMVVYNLLPLGGGDGALICKLLKER